MRISDWSSDVCSSDLVGDQSVVLGFQPRRGLARFADIGGGLDLELVRRQADYADAGEGLLRPISEVVANAGAQIPPHRDRTAVQDLEIGPLRRSAARQVGKECESTGRDRWAPTTSKQKIE